MEHLAIQILWVTIRLFVTCVTPIYLEDEFTFLFLVLLNEMRMLGKPKLLPFYCINQGNTEVGSVWKWSQEVFYKKVVLEHFAIFTKKASLLQSLTNKVAGF